MQQRYARFYTVYFLVLSVLLSLELIPYFAHNIPAIYAGTPIVERMSRLEGTAREYIPFSGVFGSWIYYIVLAAPILVPFSLFFFIHACFILKNIWNNITTRNRLIFILCIAGTLQVIWVANYQILGIWLVG